jgi:hypothetical protein
MSSNEFVDLKSSTDEPTRVAPGLAYLRDRIVNVAFIGSSDGRDEAWILVDTGFRERRRASSTRQSFFTAVTRRRRPSCLPMGISTTSAPCASS